MGSSDIAVVVGAQPRGRTPMFATPGRAPCLPEPGGCGSAFCSFTSVSAHNTKDRPSSLGLFALVRRNF